MLRHLCMLTLNSEHYMEHAFKTPYSKKVWCRENLVKYVNYQSFVKLKPSILVVTNNNIILADLFIHQTFFAKILIHPLLPNIFGINFFSYMIAMCISIKTQKFERENLSCHMQLDFGKLTELSH